MLANALPLASLFALATGPIVRWEPASGCPTEESVQAEVRRELQNAPEGPQWTIQGTVTAIGELFRLEITVDDPIFGTSQRSESAGNCEDLAQAFVLHLRQLWLSRAVAPAPRERRVQGRLRIAGDLGGGLFPGRFHGGGQIVFGLAWRRARMELGIGADGNGGIWVFGRTTTWFRPFLLVRGCGELAAGPVDFHLCAGAAGGFVNVTEKSYRHRVQPTFDLHVAPALTWWFHRRVGLWVGATGGVLLPFLKPVISTDKDKMGEVLDASQSRGSNWIFLKGSVGFEFRWDR